MQKYFKNRLTNSKINDIMVKTTVKTAVNKEETHENT